MSPRLTPRINNTIFNRAMAADPSIDLTTVAGRLAMLRYIDGWLDFAGECLAEAWRLRRAGDMKPAAKYKQQWFSIMVQVGPLHEMIDDLDPLPLPQTA